MKRYITTIKIDVYAESDESAIHTSNKIADFIRRKHNPNTELESVQEYRFYGIHNRHLDINPLLYFKFNWKNIFKIFAK